MAAKDRVVPATRVGLGSLALAVVMAAGLPAVAAPGVPTSGADPADVRVQVVNGRQFVLDDPEQIETTARLVVGSAEHPSYAEGWIITNQVIVQTGSRESAIKAMAEYARAHPGAPQVDFLRTMSDKSGLYVLGRPSVGGAIDLADWLLARGLVERAIVDHVPGRRWSQQLPSTAIDTRDDLRTGANGHGVAVVPPSIGSPRAVATDPLFVSGDFWPIRNLANPDSDHRIDEVHDDGITGEGVTIGLIGDRVASIRRSFDPIHPDLIGNARLDLGQEIDPFLPTTVSQTMVAGLIASEANAIGGVGVAYHSELVPLRNGSIGEEFDALRFNSEIIDIIYYSDYFFGHQTGAIDPGGAFFDAGTIFDTNSDLGSDRFFDPLPLIAIEEGAEDGVIYVTEAGDDSLFPGFDALFLQSTAVLRTDEDMTDNVIEEWGTVDILTGTFTSGTTLPSWGGWTEYDGIANNRLVLTIGAVGEDGLRAPYSRMGPSVFASAYSLGGDPLTFDPTLLLPSPGIPTPPYDAELAVGLGLTPPFATLDSGTNRFITSTDISTTDVGFVGVDPADFATVFGGTSAAAANATGIFALMKQANPNLTLRDIKHIIQQTATIPADFDPLDTYWFSAETPATASTWQINTGFQLHSDAYGFGIIDAKAAVDLARNWGGMPTQEVFETGTFTMDLEIPDAEYVEVAPQFAQLVPGDPITTGDVALLCVRPNIVIEEIEVEVNISGRGPGDLLIWLTSPGNSVSVFAIPRYARDDFVPTADGEFSYFNYVFHTYKHWGERAGGRWAIAMQDYGVPEVPESASMDDGGYLTDFGQFGGFTGIAGFDTSVPFLADFAFAEKTWVDYNFRIYGYQDGAAPFEGCPIGSANCPGDLNSDFVVDINDLLLYLEQFENGSLLADINGDGRLDLNDILAFISLWQPGFCNVGGNSAGSRPLPTDSPNPAIGPGGPTDG